MNDVPPSEDPPDHIDDLYRRAGSLDTSRPSEAVRRAVLDHAERLAAERLPEAGAAGWVKSSVRDPLPTMVGPV